MQTIDLRGVSCPTNFVKAKLALEDLQSGTAVALLLDDGEPARNVPGSLTAEGHHLIDLQQSDEGHYILKLKKSDT